MSAHNNHKGQEDGYMPVAPGSHLAYHHHFFKGVEEVNRRLGVRRNLEILGIPVREKA